MGKDIKIRESRIAIWPFHAGNAAPEAKSLTLLRKSAAAFSIGGGETRLFLVMAHPARHSRCRYKMRVNAQPI
jgi:hypothetical protein